MYFSLFANRHVSSLVPEAGNSGGGGGSVGLDGAIQRLIINRRHSLTNLAKLSRDARNVGEYVGAPCTRNLCQNNGSCVAHFRRAVCRCRRKFYGKHCELQRYGTLR
jgi:hypothetical protein